jgi:hypothetical protein
MLVISNLYFRFDTLPVLAIISNERGCSSAVELRLPKP